MLLKFARLLDKLVNLIAIILFLLLLLYAGHSIWYQHSVKNESFLSDELAKYRHGSQEAALGDLVKINRDVISWVTIKDTNIDYPVLQGKDDNEYLNKTVFGEFSLAGSLFLSSANKRDFSDPYNLVYGHHVEGGAMLADVLEFRDASYFKDHVSGVLRYPDEDGKARADRIEIFAVVDTNGNDDIIYPGHEAMKRKDLPRLIKRIDKKAVNKRDIDLGSGARVIAFSTCENAESFERVILFGKLVPMTEEEIRKAEEEAGNASSARGKHGILGIIGGLPPWVLPSAGAMLLLLLLYVIWRKLKDRAERDKYGSEK